MRLIDFFDRGLRRNPEGICLLAPHGPSFSYRQCADLTHRIANGLHAAGVGAGSKVGLLTTNHVWTMLAMLGTARSAGTLLPVNSRNAMEENLRMLVEGDCDFLFLHADFAGALARIREVLPSLKGLVMVDRFAAGVPCLEAWVAEQPATPVYVDQRPDDVVAIRGTGGTTGLPKGVMVTNRMYETLFANLFASVSLSDPPVHLVVAPLTHAAGTISLAACAWGGVNVILADTDPGAILSAIERYCVSLLFLPPTVIYRLLAHPDLRRHDYSALRHFIYAAAPMSLDKLGLCIEVFGPVMVQAYGQAEAPFFCTCLTTEDHRAASDPALRKRLSSCGRATPFTVVEIMDDEGRLLGPGELGEIVVRGELVMKGYYRNPQATAAALYDGWLHTGDIGLRDEDGYFYIVDRKKDMIISGGFNVYPSEVEQVIWSWDGVQDCAVIGVPDPDWGEAVKAVVELKAGATLDTAALIAHCRERLGPIKTPKSVEVWPTLPRSQVGKVLKRDIRDRFWIGHSRRI